PGEDAERPTVFARPELALRQRRGLLRRRPRLLEPPGEVRRPHITDQQLEPVARRQTRTASQGPLQLQARLAKRAHPLGVGGSKRGMAARLEHEPRALGVMCEPCVVARIDVRGEQREYAGVQLSPARRRDRTLDRLARKLMPEAEAIAVADQDA